MARVNRDTPRMSKLKTLAGNERYSVSVARSVKEVEELRPIWERMQWHPYTVIDRFLALVELRPEIVRPHVLLISENDEPKLLVVGQIENKRHRFEFGYFTLFKPMARVLAVLADGIFGELTPELSKVLAEAVQKALVDGEADMAHWAELPIDSDLFPLAKSVPPVLCRGLFNSSEPHWRLRLPATFEEFKSTRSRKSRANLRRYMKRLLRDHGDCLRWKCYRHDVDLDRLAREMEIVAAKTYQRGLGQGFENNAEQRRLMEIGFARDGFRVYMLYINDQPSAFWSGYSYGKVFITETPGFDPAYRSYGIGNFVLMKLIEDLCDDEEIEILDYGFGDAEYKQSFSSEKTMKAHIPIFAPTFKGLKINAMRTQAELMTTAARYVLTRTNLYQKVKRVFRDRLSAREG